MTGADRLDSAITLITWSLRASTGFQLLPIQAGSAELVERFVKAIEKTRFKARIFETLGSSWRRVPDELTALCSGKGLDVLWAREWDSPDARATMSELNVRRDALQKSSRPLLLVGPAGFLAACVLFMPDLWSVRSTSLVLDPEDHEEVRITKGVWPRFWRRYDESPLPEDSRYPGFLAEDPMLPTTGDLFGLSRVVLLGAPGSGKTWEMLRWVEKARGHGLPELRELRDVSGLADWLIQWRDGGERRELFLDGLDEALDLDPSLLGKLSSIFRTWPAEAPLRISCRSSRWPRTIEESLRRHEDDESTPLHVLELCPLLARQVPKETLERMSSLGATVLIAQPLGLSLLPKGGAPSSAVELYEQGCLGLALETSDFRKESRQPGLLPASSPEERVESASEVAAALLLTGCDRLLTEPEVLPIPGMIHRDVLKKWTPGDRLDEAMSTRLFVKGAGRYAFLHRKVAEFLAARALDRALRKGCATEEVAGLLLGPKDDLVAPSLEEVACWLASMNADFRDRLLARQPELFLRFHEHGDPTTRGRTLDAIFERAEGWLDARQPEVITGLAKLAGEDLAVKLQEYAFDGARRPLARLLALKALMERKHAPASARACKMALDEAEPAHLRGLAVKLVDAAGTPGERRRVSSLVKWNPEADPDREVQGAALWAFWPLMVPRSERFTVLDGPPAPGLYGSYLSFLQIRLPEALLREDLPEAIRWFTRGYTKEDSFSALLAGATPRTSIPDQVLQSMHEPDVLEVLKEITSRPHQGERSLLPPPTEDPADDERRRPVLLELMKSRRPDEILDGLHWLPGLLSSRDLGFLAERYLRTGEEFLVTLLRACVRFEDPIHAALIRELVRADPRLRDVWPWFFEDRPPVPYRVPAWEEKAPRDTGECLRKHLEQAEIAPWPDLLRDLAERDPPLGGVSAALPQERSGWLRATDEDREAICRVAMAWLVRTASERTLASPKPPMDLHPGLFALVLFERQGRRHEIPREVLAFWIRYLGLSWLIFRGAPWIGELLGAVSVDEPLILATALIDGLDRRFAELDALLTSPGLDSRCRDGILDILEGVADRGELEPESVTALFDLLLSHRPERALTRAIEALRLDREISARIATSLVAKTRDGASGHWMPFFRRDEAWADAFVNALASRVMWGLSLLDLGAETLGKLYEWLIKKYPGDHGPPRGDHMVAWGPSPEELRYRISGVLSFRATEADIAVLKRLAEIPAAEVDGMKWRLADALKKRRSEQPRPSVDRVFEVLRGGKARAFTRTPLRTRPLTVYHLSDLHFDPGQAWDSNQVFMKLARDLAMAREEVAPPDLVIVTGDIAFSGVDYSAAESWFTSKVRPLLAPDGHLLLVPGNHDVLRPVPERIVDRQKALLAEEEDFDGKIARALSDEVGRQNLLERLEAFHAFRKRLCPEMPDSPWFGFRVEADAPIRLLALCSCWMSHRKDEDRDRALALGLFQVNQCLDGEPFEGLTIGAMHHPFSCFNEKDSPARGRLERELDLLLCGHYHKTSEEAGLGSRCLVHQEHAGFQGGRHENGWSLIQVDEKDGEMRVRVRPRRWNPESHSWEGNLNRFQREWGEFRRSREGGFQWRAAR